MRDLFKKIAHFLAIILVLPLYVLLVIVSWFDSGNGTFWSCSQFLSLFPGTGGNYLRSGFYRLAMKNCHRESAILFGTIFSQRNTEIGRGVYIGPQCNIGLCVIGDDCTIGSGVHVMSGKQQHHFEDISVPIRKQGGIFDTVEIGEDAWIGNCSVIMANVGKKCIVGAGSVVVKDVDDYSIVAGNPARVIKKRV